MTYANAEPMYRQWKRRKWLIVILAITLLTYSWYLLNCWIPYPLDLINQYPYPIRRLLIAVVVAPLILPLSLLVDRCPRCNIWRPTQEQPYMLWGRELLSCKRCGIRLNRPTPPVQYSVRRIVLGVLLGLCCGVPILFYGVYSLGKLPCP